MKPLPYFLLIISSSLFTSCSVSKRISKQANKLLLQDTAIRSSHIGISIYEPATGKYLYEHDAEKYFVPASNTKLFTLYAGMKYLGDSLIGLRYFELNDSTTIIQPTGDPTFLHKDFKTQRVFSLLSEKNKIRLSFLRYIEFLGKGWAWDDYKEYYMAQRCEFPVYGNVMSVKWINKDSAIISPPLFKQVFGIMEPLKNGFEIVKTWDDNQAILLLNGNLHAADIPFRPDVVTINALLCDTLKKKVDTEFTKYERKRYNLIYSQASDSLFKPMMHNSDNFFAEQSLLMVSNEMLGEMSDEKIIDTLLKGDLKDVPQKPQWVDGSGLSRYNQFTPKDFVYILNKMRNEFGFDRMKNILATGGAGTLKSYYRSDSGYIYAKTGTLSNHLALSGYIITRNNRFLIFSILVNHYQTQATPVRKAIEQFLKKIRKDY